MTWEDYYEKICDWSPNTMVNRMSKLSSFGPPEEIIEVIMEIAFEDEKGATRLLKKAIDAGVKFSGEQLADICLCCSESELERAVRFSADKFADGDIEHLYCCYDEDLLVEIAKKYNLKLPADLKEGYADDIAEDIYEYEMPELSKSELQEAYDYVLQCLNNAHEKMILALRLSIADVGSKKRAISIAKYACLLEAEPFIEEARITLEEIEAQVQVKTDIRNIRLNMGKRIVFSDVVGEGVLVDFLVQRHIKKMVKAVADTYREVQKLKEKVT